MTIPEPHQHLISILHYLEQHCITCTGILSATVNAILKPIRCISITFHPYMPYMHYV